MGGCWLAKVAKEVFGWLLANPENVGMLPVAWLIAVSIFCVYAENLFDIFSGVADVAESSREVAVGLVLGVAVLSIIGLLSRVAGDTLDLVLGAAVLCIGGMLSGVVDVLDLWLGLGLGLWGASPEVGFSRLDSVTRDAVGFLLGLGGLR